MITSESIDKAYERLEKTSIIPKATRADRICLHHGGLTVLKRVFNKAIKHGRKNVITPLGERPATEAGFLSVAGCTWDENKLNASNGLPLTSRRDLEIKVPTWALIESRREA